MIQITIDWPRWCRNRRRKAIGLGVLAALVVAVPVAWAAHDFTDVPDASPFHGDIAAVKRAGITSGKTCVPPGTPPTYCPGESITREAMAAFVHRGFSRVGYAGTLGLLELPSDQAFIDLAVVTIAVGGVPGGTQFVKLDAMVRTANLDSNTVCPCGSTYRIERDGVGAVSQSGFNMNQGLSSSSPPGLSDEVTGAVTTVVAVPSGTTQTFRLRARRYETPVEGTVFGRAALSAITAPFGSTGTDTLG
jgi:hypothetical protein